MNSRLRRVWRRIARPESETGLRFDRPLLLFQSDDWGRVGVRDREGWQELQVAGVPLGETPYDFYSLETAEDLQQLSNVLKAHHDEVGHHPSIGMNFIMANVDFARYFESGGGEIPLVPLTQGLPGRWHRPGLLEAYRAGIAEGLFSPALHGLTHFCEQALKRELATIGERRELLTKMWQAETPYIYRRMPWIGFEYWDSELSSEDRFMALADQRVAIRRAAEIYQECFGSVPISACAPGYRANEDTRSAWFEVGVRVAQNGPEECRAPYLDNRGMLQTFRTVEMEPAMGGLNLDSLVEHAELCFRRGVPAIVSAHSVNFHSTLRDFRTATLRVLDDFLTRIEKRWPSILYLHDEDLLHIASEGYFLSNRKRVEVATLNQGARN